ncbi:Seryl-tRNA synthetase [Microcystis panniformis FACHB-1757]|uniref:Seryl-tRNA synthetase n=1 Tax=Microcystis panniformis FACHB-1757 TaxID=1638788 RepID=A0A0K1RX61_9CHRO|nr:Seryl-tRNA synthetase [Microcystis panniformis FACHB-1757]
MSGRWVSCFNPTYVHLIFNSTHLLNRVFQMQEQTPSIPEKLYIEMNISQFTGS